MNYKKKNHHKCGVTVKMSAALCVVILQAAAEREKRKKKRPMCVSSAADKHELGQESGFCNVSKPLTLSAGRRLMRGKGKAGRTHTCS